MSSLDTMPQEKFSGGSANRRETYKDYLQSDDWKRKKRMKPKKRCGICGTGGRLDCHHLNYKNLYDVKEEDLVKLCRPCHDTVHFLMKKGKIIFKDDNPWRKFNLVKIAVKKYMGLSNVNLFNIKPSQKERVEKGLAKRIGCETNDR